MEFSGRRIDYTGNYKLKYTGSSAIAEEPFFMVELIKIGTEKKIQLREDFAKDVEHKASKSGILLQTCNRIEWYYGEGKVSNDIANHLFRVVSGLESSLLGETSIVNQVKIAYRQAAEERELDKSLHKLFQTALFVGKKVRSETKISEGAMSHSQAVVDVLQRDSKDLRNLNITLVGANKLNEKIIQFLVNKGVSTIFIGNRTYEKAKSLADRYNSKALRFDGLAETLKHTDVLVSATAAPHLILKKEKFSYKQPMVIFDLAVPRDIDPKIGNLSNVRLYNIETIEKEINNNVKSRQSKIEKAEEIIKREVEIFSKNQAYGQARI